MQISAQFEILGYTQIPKDPPAFRGQGHPQGDSLPRRETVNDLFGKIEWEDADRIQKVISEEIPAKVAADKAYQNAIKNSDKQNARIEHDKALKRVITELLFDQTELFKQFSDNQSFKKWLSDTVFNLTYSEVSAG